jgi:hypothetical protein
VGGPGRLFATVLKLTRRRLRAHSRYRRHSKFGFGTDAAGLYLIDEALTPTPRVWASESI